MKHTAIITVLYENYTVVNEFIESLSQQKKQNFHLYILDASANKKPLTIRSISHTIIPINNNGYAFGVNIGLRNAISDGYSRFCVINDDVICEKNFTDQLERAFEVHPGCLIGGKIYYAQGYEYHKDRYQHKDLGNVIWYAGGTVDWAHATTGHIGVDEVDHGQFDQECSTEFITGCLMCFDKKIIDTLGYWDEKYFLYYEDADYCERTKRKNIEMYYIPSIKIWHKNAQSTEGSGSKLHEQFQKKAQLRFALKYAPFRTKIHVIKNYLMRR
ncbi:hypothetical protein CO051_02675 [Candidatus Roizmanbacteria bacterium CG_4_9_14_0_2_um_filter_39_13]|uniref:Glycosyltransferase 2-like domain-containing protein n=1 Tax=Candidatus Roizmanbacteria bacterium CG_4_9_14_0_2_um_filter_39_13 TaxID=1974839 RepID=A0A2M8F080_9BACT|nr:MAG: hypothetical protein COY15_04250 [Candidatus Roizmanbacteria bacterium CG_4_10_14_0_2_um_filter_39_12]PJC32702.1 MAG: hypothetical protein CO051_02675 [Candidatus Roizmanbacteria bacterium CG_4_9_14_0_2_um_filter_39_13]